MGDLVVIVNGLPAAGKTILSRALAARLDWPLISKDTIKESLFESLGWSDRARSRELGLAAIGVMRAVVSQVPGNVILESIFTPEFADDTRSQLARGPSRDICEVLCDCPPDEALRRFRARIVSGERHPGHAQDSDEELARLGSEWQRLIAKPVVTGLGPLLRVDTTQQVDVAAVADWIRGQPGS